jgi:Zn-dependent protease with chaperone function
MTWLFVAGWAVGALAVVALAVTSIGPALLLRRHGAMEAGVDQAPLAQALLAELALAARIICPRLFVIAAPQPNGFALAGREASMVAVTEGVFDRLDRPQLRGLLALLVSRLAHPRARIETTVAALAMVLAPFVLPSMVLVRIGLRGDRWYETDDSAADLVGIEAVAGALERLEADRAGGRLETKSASNLFCVNPDPSSGLAARAFATHPTTDARIARLRQTPSPSRVVQEPDSRGLITGRR